MDAVGLVRLHLDAALRCEHPHRLADERGSQMIARWMTDEVLTAVQRLKPIAEEAGITMAQLAVAWVLKNPNVASAIIGASRPEQVHENVKAVDVELGDDVLARIDDVLAGVITDDPRLTAQG